MNTIKTIESSTLRDWLEAGRPVNILDIRPLQERAEWSIPSSIHINAYDQLKAGSPNALKGIFLDKDVPIVTVCAAGRTSLLASELLQQEGYESYSLKGGMKGWTLSWN